MRSRGNMSTLNKVKLDDVSQFSSNDEVCLALVGKYAKQYTANYQLSIIKNVCIINTTDDCIIDIPNHRAFAFEDESGRHIQSSDDNKLAVQGVATVIFHITNT